MQTYHSITIGLLLLLLPNRHSSSVKFKNHFIKTNIKENSLSENINRYETILQSAAAANHWQVVKSLTDKPCANAFLDKATNIYKNTALHIAASYGHSYIVNKLIKAGANVNLLNNSNHTPLDLAFINKKYKTAEIILNNNGILNSLNVKDLADIKIEEVIKENCFKSAQFLISKLNTHNKIAVDPNSNIAHLCASLDLKVPVLLDKLKVNASILDTKVTPLYIACDRNNYIAAKSLLELGANPNKQNSSNWSSLHVASCKGYMNIVKLLLKYNANTELKTSTNKTVIDITHSKPIKQMLFKYKNHVEEKLKIQSLINTNNLSELKLLISNSNFISSKAKKFLCHNSSNLIHIMAFFNITSGLEKPELASQLNLEHEIYNATPLFIACKRENIDFAKKILDLGANPNKTIKNNWTALHEACNKDNLELIKLLVKQNANIELCQNDGWNALDFARNNRNAKAIAFLSKKLA